METNYTAEQLSVFTPVVQHKILSGLMTICGCGKAFGSRGLKCRDCLRSKCIKCKKQHFNEAGKFCNPCRKEMSMK